MSDSVNLTGLKTRLCNIIRRVETGEELMICRRDVPVARLIPLEGQASASGKLSEVRGWLDDDDDFPDVVEARRYRGEKAPVI
ncbi:type II toxin-antitoxin system prevent-host-death family antitoxin [Luteolibacter flavescens]|uniref:Type II toxin-antitoxin system prevent-host-death family antitoxin n=1 Tax=Luteolibacter flavescens TaxID=1859460 RepID=A0ABT3FK50_9BACT|nr:type II toxin-antitoxin system prevent-host-death family antitoxin [Luteolibacter flavescens]MCW1883958.1 type II toxin-antitoxin system prevent-host-death family antitoxin [Luteolibacter flavescens]